MALSISIQDNSVSFFFSFPFIFKLKKYKSNEKTVK